MDASLKYQKAKDANEFGHKQKLNSIILPEW